MTIIKSTTDLLLLEKDETSSPHTLIFDTNFDPRDQIDLTEYPIQSIIYGTDRLQWQDVFPGKDFDAGKVYTRFQHIEFADKLPKSLESLTYEIHRSSFYKETFVNQVPFKMMENLKVLKFGDYFNGSIDFEMLPKLESIDFGCGYTGKLPESFFLLKHLKKLKLVCYNHIFPALNFPQLEELELLSYNHPIDLTALTQLRVLTLTLMSHPIAGKLPHQCLEEFNIGVCHGTYNHPLDDDFGKFTRLKRLMLGGRFNYPLPQSFRDLKALTFLWLGNNFNQEIDGYLPDNLEKLCFAWSFNRALNQLPAKLRELSLGHNFNQSLNRLPNSLRKLSLSWCYTLPFPTWTSELEELAIYGECPLETLVLHSKMTHVILPQKSKLNQLQLKVKLEEFKVLFPNTLIRFNGD